MKQSAQKLGLHSIQTLFPIAILTLLAALTFWLQRAAEIRAPRNTGLIRHDPDYSAEKFTVRSFGPNGDLKSKMAAEKMLHYPDDESTLVTEPRISNVTKDHTVLISARSGNIAADAREVVLTQDVRVIRQSTKLSEKPPITSEPPTVLTTSALTVLPDDEVAHTTWPVLITQGASVMRGTGLEADNKTAIYKLLSRVSGTIEKKH